jgi:Family of unknown function (DUF6308)
MAATASVLHNTFCRRCLQTGNRLVTSTKFCPDCGEQMSPLPPHFVAQLRAWVDPVEQRHPAAASGIASAPGQPLLGRIRLAHSGKRGHAPRLELVVRIADGGNRLPGPGIPFPLLLGARGNETTVEAKVGKGPNMPIYFRAHVEKAGARVKLSDELNYLGYGVGDQVEIEAIDNGTCFAIRPTDRPREQAPLLKAPDTKEVPALKAHRTFHWSTEELRRSVAEYDAGTWRGKSNVELDRRAYRLFADGLEVDDERLIDMIEHVGAYYGGAYRPDGEVRAQARKIASTITGARSALLAVLRRQVPLIDRTPQVNDVDDLTAPFRRDKTSFVWGAKFLHFLKPDVFPLIDHRIETALGRPHRISNSSGYLVAFCDLLRKVVLENLQALKEVRRNAPEHAEPSILKVLDKVLWVKGREDRSLKR